MLIQEQFGIIQNLQTFPIPQTSFLVWTFFVASYSKTVLEPGSLASSYAEAVGLKRNLKEKCSKRMTTTGTTSKKHNPSVVNPIAQIVWIVFHMKIIFTTWQGSIAASPFAPSVARHPRLPSKPRLSPDQPGPVQLESVNVTGAIVKSTLCVSITFFSCFATQCVCHRL